MFHFTSKYPEVLATMSERIDGTMIIPRIPDPQSPAYPNRTKFLATLKLLPTHVVSARLEHGKNIHVASPQDAGAMIQGVDGLVTNVPNIALSVTGADCLPLYFYDPEHRAVGIAHAGWRGVVANIASSTIGSLHDSFGSLPNDILVGIGPGICSRHFLIQGDVIEQFAPYASMVKQIDNKHWSVDLPGIIRRQLRDCGIESKHVEQSLVCTFEDAEQYFSYRRDKLKIIEAVMALTMIRVE